MLCGLHKTIPASHPHVSGGFQGCNIQVQHMSVQTQDHLRSSLIRVDHRDFKTQCTILASGIMHSEALANVS